MKSRILVVGLAMLVSAGIQGCTRFDTPSDADRLSALALQEVWAGEPPDSALPIDGFVHRSEIWIWDSERTWRRDVGTAEDWMEVVGVPIQPISDAAAVSLVRSDACGRGNRIVAAIATRDTLRTLLLVESSDVLQLVLSRVGGCAQVGRPVQLPSGVRAYLEHAGPARILLTLSAPRFPPVEVETVADSLELIPLRLPDRSEIEGEVSMDSRWISGPWLDLGDSYLQVLADTRSDRRILRHIARSGSVSRDKALSVPVFLTSAEVTSRRLLGMIGGAHAELVLYEWENGDTLTPSG